MSLKKCLGRLRAWSFLEYAIVFAAITAAVVVVLAAILSKSGRINIAFQDKTADYIQRIKSGSDSGGGDDGEALECEDIPALEIRLQNLNEAISLVEGQMQNIDQTLHSLNDVYYNILMPSCENNCYNPCKGCLSSCLTQIPTYNCGLYYCNGLSNTLSEINECKNNCDTYCTHNCGWMNTYCYNACYSDCFSNNCVPIWDSACEDWCNNNVESCKTAQSVQEQIAQLQDDRKTFEIQKDDFIAERDQLQADLDALKARCGT
ncbi:MAG: hypothetical protein NC914_00080 [Candidatus Omnitrophica bacterium]|nr:hypothetical protein [Candidatus Omnitrophota bacterium]